ncbi:methyltransferase domain-containing protein [Candidatus Bathyarchaeota archaeon]|nr:methyltransferase domain-containing protein [Candidatus Bathyarchaeota archaeon]
MSRIDGKILNVGCGELKVNGVNLDLNRECKPDIVADFHYLPFKDKAFDYAILFDVIEHTQTPLALINESERVSKNVIVEVLDFDEARENWVADAQHKFYINEEILKKLLPNYHIFKLGKMLFASKIRITLPKIRFLMWKALWKLTRKV